MDTFRYVMAVLILIGLPPGLVYWFIVHPKLSDELATYIDPDAVSMDTPAPPPDGKFWRWYIYTSSDPNPWSPPENWLSLREMLAGCETLWNSQSNLRGAPRSPRTAGSIME